jgi:hypothetical protein
VTFTESASHQVRAAELGRLEGEYRALTSPTNFDGLARSSSVPFPCATPYAVRAGAGVRIEGQQR